MIVRSFVNESAERLGRRAGVLCRRHLAEVLSFRLIPTIVGVGSVADDIIF
jgi:hypothetical protein